MKVIYFLTLILFCSVASAFEMLIFNEKWVPPADCQLVASDKKYSFGTHLRCIDENVYIEIYLEQYCPLDSLKELATKSENSVKILTQNGIEYHRYKLINKNDGEYQFSRVIKNAEHCIISFSDSENAKESLLNGLWVVE